MPANWWRGTCSRSDVHRWTSARLRPIMWASAPRDKRRSSSVVASQCPGVGGKSVLSMALTPQETLTRVRPVQAGHQTREIPRRQAARGREGDEFLADGAQGELGEPAVGLGGEMIHTDGADREPHMAHDVGHG